MASFAGSGSGSSHGGSVASSHSPGSVHTRAEREYRDGQNEDLLNRRPPLENAIFGVLFTLSKESSDTKVVIRWVLLKILLDAWQLFTTIIAPARQGWNINADGSAWSVLSVLNFTWLSDLGYGAYLAVLYAMVALLMGNVGLCIWVAWCFKEQKFPVIWPIKVLRVFSSVFFQAFDVASLNLLQLGISCNYWGDGGHRLYMSLFPRTSCSSTSHVLHAIVSALSLLLFVIIALLLNLAEVEVNPVSRRPLALGHSGAEVMAFTFKVLLTMVDVFIGYKKVAACVYLALSLGLAWQSLRWNPHLVAWVNSLKGGVAVTVVWCCAALMLLVFQPGVKAAQVEEWSEIMTLVMLVGLAPAFLCGALTSFLTIRTTTRTALKALANAKPDIRLEDVCQNLDDPRDVETVARCCRVWKDRYTLDTDAVNQAHQVIKAGLAMFPNSAYMVLLHGNFMIDVLGVGQSGSSRIEDARKLNPSLMCRFIMFVRQQQATQKAAGKSANDGNHMDLLGYVEYQRKQRMVVRLHREALQAMCNFWRALDASRVSFMHLSRALSKIESSVSQAQTAYRVVLENYGHNPKLVRLYGKFLQTIKNDPWRASEYFTEADRLEEIKNGDSRGPLLPDGTPLGRMDEMSTAVMVLTATGKIQMANRHTHTLFGYKRGSLEGKPLAILLAPHTVRKVTHLLAMLVAPIAAGNNSLTHAGLGPGAESESFEEAVVGMHYDRLAFRAKLSVRKVSGVGEDSTFVVMLEPVSSVSGIASLWVSPNGTVAACDPQFVSSFGWRPYDINGSNLNSFLAVAPEASYNELQTTGDRDGSGKAAETTRAFPEGNGGGGDALEWLLCIAKEAVPSSLPMPGRQHLGSGVRCILAHKYGIEPVSCTVAATYAHNSDIPMLEVHIQLDGAPSQLLVINRKGIIVHTDENLVTLLKDASRGGGGGFTQGAGGGVGGGGLNLAGGGAGGACFAAATCASLGLPVPAGSRGGATIPGADDLTGFSLFDFMPAPWGDMHLKFLRDTAPASTLNRNAWSCRKTSLPGPTLELRNASGNPLFMHVSVSSADVAGEFSHVIRMARSSPEDALAERRLRLSVSEDGLVTSIISGDPDRLFGLEPTQVLGRSLWELMKEAGPSEGGRLGPHGPEMFRTLISSSLLSPGYSWRVQVSAPQMPVKEGSILELVAATRAAMTKLAIMQADVVIPDGVGVDHDNHHDNGLQILVDLWPVAAVTGVLDLDSSGRVRAVLEEKTRPVGLLFGVPSQSLVGQPLGVMVALPPRCGRPDELLSLQSTKKSSLKATRKESSVKVGPVHVLRGIHVDGLPASIDVQVVGKPGSSHSFHAILRFHASLLPRASNSARVTTSAAARKAAGAPIAGVAGGIGQAPQLTFQTGVMPQTQFLSDVAAVAVAAVASQRAAMQRLRAQSPPQQMEAEASLVTKDAGLVDKRLRNEPYDAWEEAEMGGKGAVIAGVHESLLQPALLFGMEGAPPTPLQGPTQIGYSMEVACEGTSKRAAAPPDVAGSGMPVPAVTTSAAVGKATQLALGRSKLADLVKSVDEGDADACRPQRTPPLQQQLRRGSSHLAAVRLPSGGMSPRQQPLFKGTTGDLNLLLVRSGTKESLTEGVEVNSCVDSDGRDSNMEVRKNMGSHSRISAWVASQEPFQRNRGEADPPSDEDNGGMDGDGERNPDIVLKRHAGVHGGGGSGGFGVLRPGSPSGQPPRSSLLSSGGRNDLGGNAEDDAASEGGQSALSAQSASGGAEYKRGKRFRKLVKLMDSSQAQQVQQRFRTHALATVAVLAVVHIVCFTLVVKAIQSQRSSMMKLGHSGEAQRFMHQIMTDVRSLDAISINKTNPRLYNASLVTMFLDRIALNAERVKDRLNEILDGHRKSDSKVLQLFFFTHTPAWNGNELDGSDMYTNLTIWDFSTRFYSMATSIVQNHKLWTQAQQLRVAETAPGQFLLKSGPDLFRLSRRILDELLFEAADNVHWVDRLQLIFLAVEGTLITFLAALYLAYLLRAVAAQRHKLYCTFLVVPLGLTRALASQNTSLLVDEDDDDDLSDEEERGGITGVDDGETDADVVISKARRRATLNVGEMPSRLPDGNDGVGHSRSLSRMLSSRANGSGGLGGEALESRSLSARFSKRMLTIDANDSHLSKTGFRSWRVWSILTRRRPGTINPLVPVGGGSSSTPCPSEPTLGKRRLKVDSHETFVMMIPFVFWSAVVITIYSIAVIQLKGVVDVVAIHSVANFMAARTYRTVFFSQELAVEDNPTLLATRRAAVSNVLKLVTDAWYTLQLGENAYRAAGSGTERFPLVKEGLAYSSPELAEIFYSTGKCLRLKENLPCMDPTDDYYQVTRAGLDSMMQQFLMNVAAMASSKNSTPPGLEDGYFDLIYNVGSKDLLDGVITVEKAHHIIIMKLFHRIMVLHIVLFLVLWIVFAGFLFLLLNPLLKRITKERRHISELMSQLPLELDVERLVARALGSLSKAASPGSLPGAQGERPQSSGQAPQDSNLEDADELPGKGNATSKWKAIIRSASTGLIAPKTKSFLNGFASGISTTGNSVWKAAAEVSVRKGVESSVRKGAESSARRGYEGLRNTHAM